ncbi:MAG: hypothetical protein IJN66_04555 [Muribaculaceae bacterium]|nr:hypothetical protein [Muribaculaceae bacterium]
MKKSISAVTIILLLILSVNAVAQNTLSDDRLAHEGRRIGRAYHLAVKSGDVDMQNDALNQFNEILITLRKQSQADILSKAFNNVNIVLNTPEKDALLYSRALMNAKARKDSIAIMDAIDIAKSVKDFYAIERSNNDAERYYNLYDHAVTGADLGNEYRMTTDAMNRMDIISTANEIRQSLESDSTASEIFNDSFDYYSIALKTPEEDAIYFSTEMKKATASGQQSQVDAISRIIGMVFERYKFDCNDEAATLFNTRLNELISTK